MATIAALTENFEGGSNGAELNESNTIFDQVGNTNPPSFITETLEGSLAMQTSATTLCVCEADFTAETTFWVSFYFKFVTAPTSNTAILSMYGDSNTNKILDVQAVGGGTTIRVRSVSTTRWTSAALGTGVWHRIAVRVTVDSDLEVKIYSGANLHTTTASQSSGSQSNTNTVATNVDNVRFGMHTDDTTLSMRYDRIRGDDATEPDPHSAATDGDVAAVTATATAAAEIPTVDGETPNGDVAAVVATATASAEIPVVEGEVPTPPLFSEGGEDGTPGVSFTTADSNFTDFSGVGTIVCRTTQFVTGTQSIRIDTVADGNLAIAEWIGSVTNPFVLRVYFRPANLPVAGAETEVNIMEIRGADNTIKAMVEFTENGNISIKNGSTLVDTSTTELNINEWTRMEWRVDDVLNTQSLRLFVGENVHGTTPDETITGSYTRDSAAGFWIGVVRKALILGAWWDEIVVANDWIGPANVSGTEVVAVTATATASAPAHVVTTDTNTVVTAVTATASAAAEYPSIELEFTISGGGPATASALVLPPDDLSSVAPGDPVAATATALVLPPVVTGDGGAVIEAPAAEAFAHSMRDTLVVGTSALFTMPHFEEPMRTHVKPLNRHRLAHANSLIRINGVLREVRHPTHDQIRSAGAEGVDYFVGGHVYPVSEAIAQELTLMGYEVSEG